METKALVELVSDLSTEETTSETSFHAAWRNNYVNSYSPEELAFIGGYLSDRLAWLFVSGYQAAIRRTFQIEGPEWAAFAVSEDRSASDPLPGLVESDGLLNGNKTWVAGVEQIQQLIVTSQPDNRLWLCRRDMPGLTLTTKQQVSFLSDMSQGIANFSDSPTASASVMHLNDLKQFARREPMYLYIAFCGFLLRLEQHDDDLLRDLLQVADDESDAMAVRQLFADVDTRVARTFNRLSNTCFAGNYDADRSLMSMYSSSIQRRAQPRPS